MSKNNYKTYTFKWVLGNPRKSDVLNLFKIKEENFDDSFGIVEIDLKDNLYCVSVTDNNSNDRNISGPFSDTQIDHFGLK